MASRNINVWRDDADRPNGPAVRMPENGSAVYREEKEVRPLQPTALALLMLPVVFTFSILWALWLWAGSVLSSYNPPLMDYVLAVMFRGIVTLSIPAALLSGILILIYRGKAWVDQSRVLRLPNNTPVSVDLVHQDYQTLRPGSLIPWMLEQHYANEGMWAETSSFRNMNGAFSPSLTISRSHQLEDRGMPEAEDLNPEGPEVDGDLPPDVPLDDIGGPPGHLVYGIGPGGRIISAPVGKAYHGLRQGDTGTGKTSSMNAELVQLHRLAEAGDQSFILFGGDFKGELKSTWGKSILFKEGIATQPQDILSLIQQSLDQIDFRNQLFETVAQETGRLVSNITQYKQVTGQDLPYILMFLDEVNVLLGDTFPPRLVNQIAGSLRRGLQLGRSAGVFYEAGAQYMTAHLFGRDGSKQFVTRAYFGPWDQAAMSMVFGGRVDREWALRYRTQLTGIPGRGVFAGPGEPPIPIQSVYVDETVIIDTIARTLPNGSGSTFKRPEPARTMANVFQDAPREEPGAVSVKDVQVSQTASVDVLSLLAIDGVRQHFIRRVLDSVGKKGKRDTLYTLFGVTSGASQGWAVASSFYDDVLAQNAR